MYKKILFCLDNSDLAGYAVDVGMELIAPDNAAAAGIHVYAARLHDARFRLMEDGLPHAFKSAESITHQRKTHDTLISKGLEIISESYLQAFVEKAASRNISAKKISREGKNFEEILKEANDNDYDLVALGANGLGKTEANRIGSVCERVVRGVNPGKDVLVAKISFEEKTERTICVAIDGSDFSYTALTKATAISRIFNARIDAISVYDVIYHQTAFKSLEGVLSTEAQSLFKFKDQQKLHEDIIDKGLERVYAKFLDKAESICKEAGVAMTRTLVADKPIDAIRAHVERTRPMLLVMGRVGAHKTDVCNIGSVTENILRECDCNILISS